MITNIIIVTAMQFAAWIFCYAAGGCQMAQSLGLLIGIVLGFAWHTGVYYHWKLTHRR